MVSAETTQPYTICKQIGRGCSPIELYLQNRQWPTSNLSNLLHCYSHYLSILLISIGSVAMFPLFLLVICLFLDYSGYRLIVFIDHLTKISLDFINCSLIFLFSISLLYAFTFIISFLIWGLNCSSSYSFQR